MTKLVQRKLVKQNNNLYILYLIHYMQYNINQPMLTVELLRITGLRK